MALQFDHPNAKGVLMPGQTKCHKGKLVPRGSGDDEESPICAVLCSPVGQFPPPVNKKGTVHKRGSSGQPAAEKDGEKENVSANLPMEASVDELMGCRPCGCEQKWSCCNACAGACRIWSEAGYLAATGSEPASAAFATWDGCVPIPEESAVPAPALRAKLGARVAHLAVGRGRVSALKVTPCGTKLVVGCADGSASVYAIDPLKDDLAPTLAGVVNAGKLAARRVRPKRMCDDSEDEDDVGAPPPVSTETASTFPASSGEAVLTPGGHEGPVTCVAVAPDGGSFFTGSRDCTVKQWSLPDLDLLRTFVQAKLKDRDDVLAVQVSSDGAQLYTAGEDTCLTTWTVATGEVVSKIFQGRASGKGGEKRNENDNDRDAEVDDDGGGDGDGGEGRDDDDVRGEGPSEQEVAAEEEERRQKAMSTRAKGTPNWIQCLAVAPAHPSLVFTGSRDFAVRRWNLEKRACERTIPGHAAPVTALAMSSDGSELVSGAGRGDGTLRHYRWADNATSEWADGKPTFRGGAYARVRSFTGGGGKRGGPRGPAHPGGVAALAISADERFVYSGGAAEGALKQWSVETGEMLTTIPRAHAGGVTSMAMLPETAGASGVMGAAAVAATAAAAAGGRLITAGADGCVNVWSVDPYDAVAGATLAARVAQREAAAAAAEHQRKQLQEAAKAPELSRPQMAAKARKDTPGIERAKFPVDPETGRPKDLEDMTVVDLEPLTAAELITVCLAHGVLCIDPKRPPPTRQDIAATMVAFFEEEKEKSRVKAREERMLRRAGPKLNVLG